ncbi:MAG: efflux RND transporter permease subunit [Christensenellales bacterium]|nr:efflux RND transporter permease subunit [Christensenellales bacterium]
MLGKFSVKKPYTVIVGVILVIVLGTISFMNMTTDMLPSMNFPYVVVYTTYIGATPEQVEEEVTRPMEAAFATLTDINEIESTSGDNVSMVMLEFNESADMNTAMIEINSEITSLSADWSDSVGAPVIMKINPDMLPVAMMSVSREGMDIYELSDYVKNVLVPEFEGVEGVASVSALGMIEEEVLITIDQKRVDRINSLVLEEVDAELSKVEKELDDGQRKLNDGRDQLESMRRTTMAQLDDALEKLNASEAGLPETIADLNGQKAALEEQLSQAEIALQMLDTVIEMSDEEIQRVKDLSQYIDDIRAEKEKIEQWLDEYQAGEHKEALIESRDQTLETVRQFKRERDRLQTLVEDLKKADQAVLEQEIQQLQQQIGMEEAALNDDDAAIAELTVQRDAAQALVDALKAALEDLDTTDEPTSPVESEAPATPTSPAESEAPPTPMRPTESEAPATPTLPSDSDASVTQLSPVNPAGVDAPEDSATAQNFLVASAASSTEEELREQLRIAEEKLREANDALSDRQSRRDTREEELQALRDDLEKKQEALEYIQSGEVQARIEEAEAEILAYDAAIAAEERIIESLNGMIEGDTESVDEARAILEELNGLIQMYEEILPMLEDREALIEQRAVLLDGKAQLEDGIAQMTAVIDKLNQGIIPGGMMEGIDEDMTFADARKMLQEGRSQALSGVRNAEAELEKAAEELAKGRREFEENRDKALEEAGIDGIITVETVAGLVGAQNLSMPAGYVYDAEDQEYLVRVGDAFDSLDEMKEMLLFSMGLETVDEVRLKDIATVEITDNREEAYTKVDGIDGIMLSIEKQSTYATTEVTDRLLEHSRELTGQDSTLRIVDMYNQGEYINIVVDAVLGNLVSGGVLAMLILLLFLMDYRPTIIIACSIPISVVTAFVCMYFSDMTLNAMSLAGLALGIGMLVDNSIVAIENIFRLHNEENLPPLRACVEGVRQVSGALFASTLTTVCVFLPVLFVEGIARDLLMDIGLTIAFSLLASLLVSLTLVPTMAAALLRRRKEKAHKNHFAAIQRAYVRLLGAALKGKWLVLLTAVLVMVFIGLQALNMRMTFMPESNSPQMTASIALEEDGDIEAQKEQALALMNRMMDIRGIESVGLTSGGGMFSLGTGNEAALSYYILIDEDAGRANGDIGDEILAIARELNVEVEVSNSVTDVSMLIGSGISVDITGPDLSEIRRIALDVAAFADEIEGVIEIDNGLKDSVPEISIVVDKEKARQNNLTIGQVMQFVATKLYGKTEISEITLDGKTMSLCLIDGRNQEITPDQLRDLELSVTTGDRTDKVRIGDIAQIQETQSLSSINRRSQQRILSVTFQVDEAHDLNRASAELEARLKEYQVPEGYNVSFSGENEAVMEIMRELVFMVGISILLIFLIMVAQFQSFKSPVIVMFTIPLAFTGGFMALLLTGMDLSVIAMIGFLMLSGIIVNNGIVYVDCVNQLRIGGIGKRDALLEAGRQRLRPILMTALTTILGMSTMAMGRGMGSEMMQGMAVVTVGGLIYATLMTLFVVPVMYDLFNGEIMKAREIQMIREAAGLNSGDDEGDGQQTSPDEIQ